MNCTEIRQVIDQLPEQSAPEGELAEHLRDCELCQHYYSDWLLERELAELQVPDPSPEFLAKAIRNAVGKPAAQSPPARRSGWRWPSAVAASVVVALAGLFALWDSTPIEDSVQFADLVPIQSDYYREEVRIVIYSTEDRDNAELSIELAEDLELEGYAGKQRLAWNTRLSKGANVLTVPVLVRNQGGEVRVRSHFGDANHEVRVQVAKRDNSVQSDMWNRDGHKFAG